VNEIYTTERIRELFTDGGFWSSDDFDRWLEQHDAEVAKATEGRIIKLLEDERRKCEQAGLFANGLELREQLQTLFIGLESAIKLIKGENK
jgi:hypothetical protein